MKERITRNNFRFRHPWRPHGSVSENIRTAWLVKFYKIHQQHKIFL